MKWPVKWRLVLYLACDRLLGHLNESFWLLLLPGVTNKPYQQTGYRLGIDWEAEQKKKKRSGLETLPFEKILLAFVATWSHQQALPANWVSSGDRLVGGAKKEERSGLETLPFEKILLAVVATWSHQQALSANWVSSGDRLGGGATK